MSLSLLINAEDSCHSFESQSSETVSQLSHMLSDNCTYQNVETVVEYEWPLESGQVYFIEEYLADYLRIKHMRRLYPSIERRRIQTLDEREYLLEKGLVNELQCDLGVIVIPAEEVYTIIAPDYDRKFEIYDQVKLQRQYDRIINDSRKANFNASKSSPLTPEELRIAAVKSCAHWNASLNEATRNLRSKYFDLQTGCVHRRKWGLSSSNIHAKQKVGYFPVTLTVVPMQYVDYTPRFSSEQLYYLPLNTVLREPPVSTSCSLEVIANEDKFELSSSDGTDGSGSTNTTMNSETTSLSGYTTAQCEMGIFSSSSSTVTCSVSDFDSENANSCDSFDLC